MNNDTQTLQSSNEGNKAVYTVGEPGAKSVPGNVETAEEKNSPDEEKELQEALVPFNKFPKLKKWVLLFTDKNNKATYGNRTESAMQAYDCKDRVSAGVIGAQNFKKLRGLATVFMEDKGITVEKFLDVVVARALTSENPEWFKLAASMTDLYDPKMTSLVVNNNTQNNIQVNGEEAVDFSAKFKKFLEAE